MKLERWGVQGNAAPLEIAPGTLIAGEAMHTPWVGLVVEDGDGKAIAVLSEFLGVKPLVVDLHQLSGAWHLIDGAFVVSPVDEAHAFRLPRGQPGKPGGLIIGESGELGIIARYFQGPREVSLLYSLETGKRWQVRAGDQIACGWKLQIIPPGRDRPIDLACFPEDGAIKT